MRSHPNIWSFPSLICQCQMRQQGDEELMDKERCLTSVGIIPKSKCLNQVGGRRDGQNHLRNQRASWLEKPQKFELKTLQFQARMTRKPSWSCVSSQLLLENLSYKVTSKFKIQRLEQCNETAAAGPCQGYTVATAIKLIFSRNIV